MRYKTIVADPPWFESGGGKIKRGADRHYPLMKLDEIAALGEPLQQYIEDDAYLFCWITNNYLCKKERGLYWQDVIEAWGFRPVTVRSWAKPDIGLGQYCRGQTEHMIFAVRGKPGYPTDPETGKRRQLTTLIGKSILPREGRGRGIHSRKPSIARDEIDWYCGHRGPTLEMFCRDRYVSQLDNVWHCWGNELESNDVDLYVPGSQLLINI
jgi:N6-adenosine-specific RNA methylase IME4